MLEILIFVVATAISILLLWLVATIVTAVLGVLWGAFGIIVLLIDDISVNIKHRFSHNSNLL